MTRTPKTSPRSRSVTRARSRASAPLKPPPFQPLQLTTPVDMVPTGDGWPHEMKSDGYRLLVAVGGGTARAYTRSGLDWSEKFADAIAEAAILNVRSPMMDGEAVVMDENGRSNFQALQGALKGAPARINYVAFDLLELDGEDLTALPLTERKAKLREMLPEGSHRIRYPVCRASQISMASACPLDSCKPWHIVGRRREEKRIAWGDKRTWR